MKTHLARRTLPPRWLLHRTGRRQLRAFGRTDRGKVSRERLHSPY